MARPWVELEKDQYRELKNLNRKTGRPVSGMIREAITSFATKKDYSITIGASHLPRASRENYRRVTAYLCRSDLNLLVSISKETGRCKTHLIREAVDEYLRSQHRLKKASFERSLRGLKRTPSWSSRTISSLPIYPS
ncbi:ribbon-helix-helix domain-containing protein [Candidatus Aerophobetes bacterium]|uniref:Ribbon-helix-helix domain-containing protein n=1 Tax=Aerophobetes bacterium TaxID=2030807 RepID=A0A523RXY5_UNCAE|nr:MAG: ribbon-helix-helix domain-containing protein [Candidatus Aerophobetes bacterium]